MRKEEHAEWMGSERKDWEIDCEVRWNKAARSSPRARRKFAKWLEGFKPRSQGTVDFATTSSEQVKTTNMLLVLALVLSSVVAVGAATSMPPRGFFIDGVVLAAFGLLTLVWVRKVHFRTPI